MVDFSVTWDHHQQPIDYARISHPKLRIGCAEKADGTSVHPYPSYDEPKLLCTITHSDSHVTWATMGNEFTKVIVDPGE